MVVLQLYFAEILSCSHNILYTHAGYSVASRLPVPRGGTHAEQARGTGHGHAQNKNPHIFDCFAELKRQKNNSVNINDRFPIAQ